MGEKNVRMKNSEIVSLIESTIQVVNMDVELVVEKTGVNMMYDFIKNEVVVDVDRVQKACKEMTPAMPLTTYIKTVTIHELGHSMDRKALLSSLDRAVEIIEAKKQAAAEKRPKDLPFVTMLLEEHETDIAFEETAWANAEILNRFYGVVDWDSFEKVKDHSMATYRSAYEEDYEIFEQLRETQENIIAVYN
ncbi:integrase [Sporosarcina contaminans]|uniref:Integrase n=1 Tax=Sporosarcina contaminans TaxID=633403 RepID=A0ABW3TYG1_9BACL